ncbi:MAG: molybdopterin-synthase adenylyltransferase MoeB [Burkholderiaceae bacterium]
MDDDQLLRYSRHILLDEIGIEGQQRLLSSTMLVVGAGGLGSPAAMYLAAAGVGRLILVDDDVVDLTNLQRQILHRQDRVGQPKVASGKRTLEALNPGVEVVAHHRRLDDHFLDSLLPSVSVALDCCDNFATRHIVNRGCVAHRVPLVSGAAIRFDGQLAVFDSRDERSPCYHCLFPRTQRVDEVACSTMGVFAPLTGIIGAMQAAEAMKLAGRFGTPTTGRLMMNDARTMQWTSITIPRDPTCAVCAR